MEKTKTGQAWVFHEDVLAEKMPTWEARRIVAHGQDMMMVENTFSTGDTAPEHEHYHTQITYVIRGALQFTLEGETKVLRDGDSVFIIIQQRKLPFLKRRDESAPVARKPANKIQVLI